MSRPTKAELDQQEQEQVDPETPEAPATPEEEDEGLWDASILLAYPGYGDMAEAWSANVTAKEVDLGKSSPEEWEAFLRSIEEDLSK